nr:MAG TPA: hypothetical protein [Caudoviricetes sp.]
MNPYEGGYPSFMSPELGTHGCFISNLCTVRFCEETPFTVIAVTVTETFIILVKTSE